MPARATAASSPRSGIADSENFGVCLCIGTWAEGGKMMGKDPVESIRYFGPRGRLFKTPGFVGKVLREDWDALRPNHWDVHTYEYVYLWSDYYGNKVMRAISPSLMRLVFSEWTAGQMGLSRSRSTAR